VTQGAVDEIVKQTCDQVNEGELPLVAMDGRKYYAQALLDRYSCIKEFPGTDKPGRPRKPKQMPLHEICSGSKKKKVEFWLI